MTADPVGAVEIAERLGVKRRTVDQWRQRELGFPVPRWTVGGRPAWDWPDVEAWNTSRGVINHKDGDPRNNDLSNLEVRHPE